MNELSNRKNTHCNSIKLVRIVIICVVCGLATFTLQCFYE